MSETKDKKDRYGLIDSIRGFAIINMIIYHAMWDIVNIFGTEIYGYASAKRYIWQQGIVWCFILLSGFCQRMSRHNLKRGLLVFGAGMIISLATIIFFTKGLIIYGVLTFIGSAMIIVSIADKWLKKINDIIGITVCAVLFVIFKNVNGGYLGFEALNICRLPEWLYNGLFMTYLGFTDKEFHSNDYFSLMPWIFLFCLGYFLNGIVMRNEGIREKMKMGNMLLEAVGRKSLIIYMLHQPIIYFVLSLVYGIKLFLHGN